jgi:hypothetical protein
MVTPYLTRRTEMNEEKPTRIEIMGKLIRDEELRMMAEGMRQRALENTAWERTKQIFARVGVNVDVKGMKK